MKPEPIHKSPAVQDAQQRRMVEGLAKRYGMTVSIDGDRVTFYKNGQKCAGAAWPVERPRSLAHMIARRFATEDT